MFICPKCKTRGISLAVRWWSSVLTPGRCKNCRAVVAPSPHEGSGYVVSGILLATAGGFSALAFDRAWIFWVASLAALCILIWSWCIRPIVLLSSEQVARARIIDGGLFAFLLASLWS
jgi:hypothetical protein